MSARALHKDLAMKPLGPTSIGVQLEYHPFFFLHFCKSSSYLYFFRSWASSACSSHWAINSCINIFFILFENISISGRNDIWAMWSGNFNLVSESALSSQSVASDRAFGVMPSFGLAFTAVLTNFNFSGSLVYLYRLPYWLLPLSLLIFDRDAICIAHQLVLSGSYSRCALVIHSPRITDTRGVVFFHEWRFIGLGRVSYPDRIRNFTATSLFHKSDHLIFRLTIDSHLVQALCCLNPTIFPFYCLLHLFVFRIAVIVVSLYPQLCRP